jgi:hypothetical protein
MVFLVDPYQECFVWVVEDSSADGPVIITTSISQKSVVILKQEELHAEPVCTLKFQNCQNCLNSKNFVKNLISNPEVSI